MTPKWTVMYNRYTKHSQLRKYEFFDVEAEAEACYNAANVLGLVPTKRPFHESDRVHLGEQP